MRPEFAELLGDLNPRRRSPDDQHGTRRQLLRITVSARVQLHDVAEQFNMEVRDYEVVV